MPACGRQPAAARRFSYGLSFVLHVLCALVLAGPISPLVAETLDPAVQCDELVKSQVMSREQSATERRRPARLVGRLPFLSSGGSLAFATVRSSHSNLLRIGSGLPLRL